MTKTAKPAASAPAPAREVLYAAHRWLDDRAGIGTINKDGTVTAHTDTSPESMSAAWPALAEAGRVEIFDNNGVQRIRIIACFD